MRPIVKPTFCIVDLDVDSKNPNFGQKNEIQNSGEFD